jgi:hypothetical protein
MRVKIHNRQGKGFDLNIPLKDMVTALVEQIGKDKEDFVRRFNSLSLEEQLKLANTEEVPFNMITAFRDERLLPGTLAKLGSGKHGRHGCEIASGTHYEARHDYFFIGDRQLYFDLRLGKSISLRLERGDDDNYKVVRGKSKPNTNMSLTPMIATAGGVYVNVHTFEAGFINSKPRRVVEGDINFKKGMEGYYDFEKREAYEEEWLTNPHIFVDNPNMKHDKYTMQRLKDALKGKGVLEDE